MQKPICVFFHPLPFRWFTHCQLIIPLFDMVLVTKYKQCNRSGIFMPSAALCMENWQQQAWLGLITNIVLSYYRRRKYNSLLIKYKFKWSAQVRSVAETKVTNSTGVHTSNISLCKHIVLLHSTLLLNFKPKKYIKPTEIVTRLRVQFDDEMLSRTQV
jgi:hypothetical protein